MKYEIVPWVKFGLDELYYKTKLCNPCIQTGYMCCSEVENLRARKDLLIVNQKPERASSTGKKKDLKLYQLPASAMSGTPQ